MIRSSANRNVNQGLRTAAAFQPRPSRNTAGTDGFRGGSRHRSPPRSIRASNKNFSLLRAVHPSCISSRRPGEQPVVPDQVGVFSRIGTAHEDAVDPPLRTATAAGCGLRRRGGRPGCHECAPVGVAMMSPNGVTRFCLGISTPDPLDLVAQLLQLGDDALPLVALNLDAPVLDRPPVPHRCLSRAASSRTPSSSSGRSNTVVTPLPRRPAVSLPTFKVTGFLAGSFTGGAPGRRLRSADSPGAGPRRGGGRRGP